jgi:hypothetical protein
MPSRISRVRRDIRTGRRLATLTCVAIAMLTLYRASTSAETGSGTAASGLSGTLDDGRHDFDFSIGTWRTHISRRLHPLSGSDDWADYVGTSIVRKVWDGRGSLGETEADGPAGHLEALSLRLYNPRSHQWNLSYASAGGTTSTPSALTVPTIGEFRNGRGEFFDTELYNGRSILVRNVWSDISANSIRFEQAFSEDGGRTWEVNWIAVDTRADDIRADEATAVSARGSTLDSQRDFDFEFGAWNVHIRRLRHPISGSKEWTDYYGTLTLAPVWNGRANLGELEADGPGDHIEGLSLRLYNPKSHTWSIYWANSRDGAVGTPMVGRFAGGRGEFYGDDSLDGSPVFVRFIFSGISPTSYRLEQAFSGNGGKTWEPNWTASFTRLQR